MQKTEWEGLVHFYHVHDVSVYLGRQRGGGVSDQKNKLENKLENKLPFLVVSVPSTGVLNIC